MKISSKTPISKLIRDYPQIKEIMIEIGFLDIVKPGMLQTVGKVMTLEKGSNMKNIPMKKIREVFNSHGFIVE